MSNQIDYNNEIPKDEFDKFLKVLKEKDPKEYETESKDNFVDLYNYWLNAGYTRFRIKLETNIAKMNK